MPLLSHLGLLLFVPGPFPGLPDGLVVLGPLLQVVGVLLGQPAPRRTRHHRKYNLKVHGSDLKISL